jgi:hypothetical protein
MAVGARGGGGVVTVHGGFGGGVAADREVCVGSAMNGGPAGEAEV